MLYCNKLERFSLANISCVGTSLPMLDPKTTNKGTMVNVAVMLQPSKLECFSSSIYYISFNNTDSARLISKNINAHCNNM